MAWLATTSFCAYLAIGLLLFPDYGVSWDEPVQREYGRTVLQYVVGGEASLTLDPVRYHGPLVELLFASVELIFRLTDSRHIYLMRHLGTFLFFYGGVLAFFFLVRRLCGSVGLGLFGGALLALHPRLFADSFYNSKDLPFLAFFIVACATLVRYAARRTPVNALWHALACGVLIAIRPAGVIVPAMTLVWFAVDCWSGRRSVPARLHVAAYGAALIVVVWMTWPLLWQHPREIMAALRENLAFPFEDTVRYMGEDLAATDLPWHYLPVWIAITTPPVALGLALVGAAGSVYAVTVGVLRRCPIPPGSLLAVLWVCVPLAVILIARPVLYDGWRHAYFVYPGLALMGTIGLRSAWSAATRVNRRVARVWLQVAVGAVPAVVVVHGVLMNRAYHPLQCVYFNALAGDVTGATAPFDLDYWGLSYRTALEHVLDVDPSPDVPIFAAQEIGPANALILPAESRARLRFVEDVREARYRLTTFRWDSGGAGAEGRPFHSVVVEGHEVLAVRHVRP